LLLALDKSGLLSAEQTEEVMRLFPRLNTEGLLRVLTDKGWLSRYQVNRIVEGDGGKLRIGPYRILDQLGRGGFGCVYKAVHTLMNRVVALKVIAPEWEEDEEARTLFLREVQALTRVAHPHIAVAYDANRADDLLYLAMEYVDGPTLDQLIETNGPLPVPLVCSVLQQTAAALQYAHQHDVVHRDIKPSNLILQGAPRGLLRLTANGAVASLCVKVVDFGLARLYPPGPTQTNTIRGEGRLIGTPAFMSPEQATNIHEVDVRADLYSLGCTIYFALSGTLPFEGSSDLELVVKHREQAAAPLSKFRPDVPPGLAAIVCRLMEKQPERRFQTPLELLDALTFTLRAGSPEPKRLAETPPPHGGAAGAPAPRPFNREPPPLRQAAAPPAPPGLARPDGDRARLISLWRRWLAVVQARAAGRPFGLTEAAYKDLHRSLLWALRENHAVGNLPPDVLSRAEAAVEPWVSLRALADLDHKTVPCLAQTCLALDELIAPRPRPARWSSVWVSVLGGAALAFAVFWLTRSGLPDLSPSSPAALESRLKGSSVNHPSLAPPAGGRR
jgi:serine/threonine protein kinase